MRILVTNDDGVFSDGMIALANALKDAGHEVTVIAPSSERSGYGHSMTFLVPLEYMEVNVEGLKGVKAYSLSGTPVDCVKTSPYIMDERPDVVMSGINVGTNVGIEIAYSGTVGAAAAAIEMGIPAMAFSQGAFARHIKHLETGSAVAVNTLERMYDLARETMTLLCVNVPDLPAEKIKGVKLAEIAAPNPDFKYEKYTTLYGRKWCIVANEKMNVFSEDDDSDERWYREDYVTVTPLRFDLTDRETMARLRDRKLELL